MICGDYRSPPSRHNPDRVSPTLDGIRSRGVLRVGTTGDYRPFSFLRPDGTFEGADIDMALALAGLLDVMITYGLEADHQAHLHPELCAVPFTRLEKAYFFAPDLAMKDFIDAWLTEAMRSGAWQSALKRAMDMPE